MSPFRNWAECIAATVHARKHWSSTDFGFPRPSTTARCDSTSSNGLLRRPSSCRRRRVPTKNPIPGEVVEQVVRPTGLVDPRVEVRRASTQVDDLLSEIHQRAAARERVLVTTLTKRDGRGPHGLSGRARGPGEIPCIPTSIRWERVEIIRDLRLGQFDVLVGINLLREGLDMPEVSLVAVLDADKEGFLRSDRSLIQTIGRAARKHQRHCNSLRRIDHRLDAACNRRDESATRKAD